MGKFLYWIFVIVLIGLTIGYTGWGIALMIFLCIIPIFPMFFIGFVIGIFSGLIK